MTPDEYVTKIYELVATRGMLTEYNDGSIQRNGPSDCEDREWFASNPDRTHRVRPLCADEAGIPGGYKLVRGVRGLAPLYGNEPRMGFLRIDLSRPLGSLADKDTFLSYLWDDKVSVALGVTIKDVMMPKKFTKATMDCARRSEKTEPTSDGEVWTSI